MALLVVTVHELEADDSPIELNRDLDTVVHKVESFAGRIEEVCPSRIVAAFGVEPAEDAPRRAALTALAVRNALARGPRSQAQRAALTIAIHADQCPVGQVGGAAQMDGDVRRRMTMALEKLGAHAGPDTIVVSTAARSLLARRFEFDDARLLGYQRHPFGVAGHPGPFVGRESELGVLQARWRDALEGRGQIVAVVGEPGIGKSRLLFEFRRALGDEHLGHLEGQGESYGGSIPYLPVIALLRGFFHVDDRDDSAATGEKVRARLLALDPALAPDVSAFLVLLDAAGIDPEWRRLESARRRQRTLDALTRLVLRLSRDQPVLIVIEDLHWIDAETQAWLDRLVLSLPAARILVLVSYRPEYRHTVASGMPYTQLRLDPLPAATAEELVSALVGDDVALRPLTRLLIERTGGNPFFLEESVRTLIETRGLVGRPGAYRPAYDVQALEVPATVRAVLAARIDRLAPEDKHLLQTASVIGADVPFALLLAVSELTEDAARSGLARLQTAELLHEASFFPELEYAFKHALTHEVVYRSLLQERQRTLHGRILDAIEKLYGNRLFEWVERLAHHAVRGAVSDRAVRYLRQAGEKALARSANRQAIALFEQALAALEQLPQSRETLGEALDIRIVLGPALGAAHGLGSPEVEASYAIARDLCLRLEDRPRLFPALWGLWNVNFNRGLYREARELGEGLLGLASELEDPVLVLEAHHSLWPTLYGLGDLETAELHIEAGLARYDPRRHCAYASIYGGHDTGVCCLSTAGITAWTRGYPDRALHYVQKAERLAAEISSGLRTTMFALYYTAWVHCQRGESRASAEKGEAALESARALGLKLERAEVLARLAPGQELEEAEIAQLHQRLRSPWALWSHTFAFCLLAEAYAQAGRPDKALEVLAEIPGRALGHVYASEVHRVRGEVLRRLGDAHLSEAEACFRRAVGMSRAGRHRSLELRAATSLSRLLARHGRREEARQCLGEIHGWFTEGLDTADLREARALLDALA
ncbi:MAG: AAA family ATPase [Candidatus Rokuibacteriota bacterium]